MGEHLVRLSIYRGSDEVLLSFLCAFFAAYTHRSWEQEMPTSLSAPQGGTNGLTPFLSFMDAL